MQRIAKDIAGAIIGVQDVQNRLRVGPAERPAAVTTRTRGE
ncbi:MAG: hypothetical protein ACT4PM_11030 [Gemmatimonadales bacterium]